MNGLQNSRNGEISFCTNKIAQKIDLDNLASDFSEKEKKSYRTSYRGLMNSPVIRLR